MPLEVDVAGLVDRADPAQHAVPWSAATAPLARRTRRPRETWSEPTPTASPVTLPTTPKNPVSEPSFPARTAHTNMRATAPAATTPRLVFRRLPMPLSMRGAFPRARRCFDDRSSSADSNSPDNR